MKNSLFLLLICLVVFSCNKANSVAEKPIVMKEAKISGEKVYGSAELNEKYNALLPKIEVVNDSLKGQDFLKNRLKKVSCTCTVKNDFYNDGQDFMIRETEILINGNIRLSVYYKTGSGYIYAYNGKPFRIRNYFGRMYGAGSNIHFFLEDKECYQISENKYLMVEQPSGWSGLANQFDFYQIADLEKMEMIQFAERDDKIK